MDKHELAKRIAIALCSNPEVYKQFSENDVDTREFPEWVADQAGFIAFYLIRNQIKELTDDW